MADLTNARVIEIISKSRSLEVLRNHECAYAPHGSGPSVQVILDVCFVETTVGNLRDSSGGNLQLQSKQFHCGLCF